MLSPNEPSTCTTDGCELASCWSPLCTEHEWQPVVTPLGKRGGRNGETRARRVGELPERFLESQR